MCGQGAMTSWVHHPMRSSGELAVELVEVTTLSALSGRKAMRSDTEPGSQGSRTLRFDSMDPVSGNRRLQYHLKVHSLICKSHSLEDLDILEDLEDLEDHNRLTSSL